MRNLQAPNSERQRFDGSARSKWQLSLSAAQSTWLRRPNKRIGSTVEVPQQIIASAIAVNQIRNAYDGIEDRAVGTVFGKPHADALTIFDQAQLLTHNRVAYGKPRLDLTLRFPSCFDEQGISSRRWPATPDP